MISEKRSRGFRTSWNLPPILHCVSAIGIAEMVRCARELGLKAQSRATTWKRLASTPLPAIAALRDGGFLVLGKVGDDKALVQSPLSPKPELMARRAGTARASATWPRLSASHME
jgi:ABC-type bacteriocin/lantibiotic exporter with double-glycine peptidase domain